MTLRFSLEDRAVGEALVSQSSVEAAVTSVAGTSASAGNVVKKRIVPKVSRLAISGRAALRNRRKRGQALLLAVLLMVLAALLGSAFITVVALNLSQSARFADKQQARQSAYYGISVVQKKIVDKGLSWRPNSAGETTPQPMPNDRTYYDEFDLAQGWAASGFIKYPDPRGLSTGGSTVFMVKVEKVAAGDSDNMLGDKTTDLRITIIGRSTQDPSAFEKLVRYQPGTAKSAISGAMRTVSNWSFQDKTVPVATVAMVVSTPANSITLQPVQGRFPSTVVNGPYYVMIGDPRTNQGARGALVQNYAPDNDPGTIDYVTLTDAVSPVPQAGERVELAAGLGAPPFINYDAVGTLTTATDGTDFALSRDTSAAASSGGVSVNGGLVWFGSVLANNLRSTQSANYQSSATGTAPSRIRASGLMQVVNVAGATPTPIPPPASVAVSGQYSDGSTDQSLTGTTLSTTSADAAFPGSAGGWAALNSKQKAQLVDDGWNRLAGNQNAERQVKPFTPPDITRGTNNSLSRYLNATKFSEPASATDPSSAALYGLGKGIYINNPEDKERFDSNPDNDLATDDGRLIEMSQAQLRDLWFKSALSSVAPYCRGGTPRKTTLNIVSLEDQHLRGWLGPDEFRARGPLIELMPSGKISITLDSRDDGPTWNKGAAPYKGWRNPDGTLMGH